MSRFINLNFMCESIMLADNIMVAWSYFKSFGNVTLDEKKD